MTPTSVAQHIIAKMHSKTRTRAVAAFLYKAGSVPQPCRTAVRAERQQRGSWVPANLWLRKRCRISYLQSNIFCLYTKREVGSWRSAFFHVHRQTEQRKGKQTLCLAARLGVSAESQALSMLAAFQQWHWYIYNSQDDWGRTWRDWDEHRGDGGTRRCTLREDVNVHQSQQRRREDWKQGMLSMPLPLMGLMTEQQGPAIT